MKQMLLTRATTFPLHNPPQSSATLLSCVPHHAKPCPCVAVSLPALSPCTVMLLCCFALSHYTIPLHFCTDCHGAFLPCTVTVHCHCKHRSGGAVQHTQGFGMCTGPGRSACQNISSSAARHHDH